MFVVVFNIVFIVVLMIRFLVFLKLFGNLEVGWVLRSIVFMGFLCLGFCLVWVFDGGGRDCFYDLFGFIRIFLVFRVFYCCVVICIG